MAYREQYESKSSSGLPFAVFGGAIALVFAVLFFVVWLLGSSNVDTPAGYVGYLTQRSAFGQTKFYGLQKGPVSSGRVWLIDEPVNVSVTPTTLTEEFAQVVTKDKITMSFQIHVQFHIPEGEPVRDLVEHYSTLHEVDIHKLNVAEHAFAQFIKEPLRTRARAEVETRNADQSVASIMDMSKALTDWTRDYCKNSPFKIDVVSVGNMQYPKNITDATADALAKEREIEKARNQTKVNEAQAQANIAEARGKAESARIMQEKLTPLFVQYEALKMIKEGNVKVMLMPAGRGGVPLIYSGAEKD